MYCVPCTVYCVLCTVYCVLCTVYCVLCTVYCVLCTDKGRSIGIRFYLLYPDQSSSTLTRTAKKTYYFKTWSSEIRCICEISMIMMIRNSLKRIFTTFMELISHHDRNLAVQCVFFLGRMTGGRRSVSTTSDLNQSTSLETYR